MKDIDSNSCENWVHEDCSYPNEAIYLDLAPGEIRDASHCHKLCNDLDSSCKYWVFEESQFHCTLYYEFDVYLTCSAINGPQYPERKNCAKGNKST